MRGNAAPGWYPDPSGGGQWRYWDGQRWGRAAPTAGFQPPIADPAADAARSRKRTIWTGAVVAGFLVVGATSYLIDGHNRDESRAEKVTETTTSTYTLEPSLPHTPVPRTVGTTDKYRQTWAIPYSQTTCSQFKVEMTAQQQWAMAADMLTNARNVDSNTGLPPDSMISEFEGGLHNACVIDTMTMSEVGAGLYLTEPRFHPR